MEQSDDAHKGSHQSAPIYLQTCLLSAPASARTDFQLRIRCLMRKGENHCGDCGGKFGLVHHHAMLKFCRKACKDNFLAKL
jgi:hypothetical protein